MFIFVLLEFFYCYYYFLEFIIYRLFLFPTSSLVRQVIPLRRFFLVPPPPVTCFYLCLVTTEDIVLFHLGIVVRVIEIVQMCTDILQNYYEGKIVR